jgi:hypothetical protein
MDGWMDGCSNLIGIGSAHAKGEEGKIIIIIIIII